MPPRPLDAKAREKRQRMIAIGGGAVLLLVLVIQVPKTLKMLHKSAPPPAAQPAPAQPAPSTGVAPTLSPSSSSEVADTVIVPSVRPGQLISFSRFSSKDPFVQQVSPVVAPSTSSVPAAAATPASTPPTTTTTPAAPTTTTAAAATPTPTAPSTRTPSTLASAPISVNGVAQTVEVGALFPKKQRIFRLVSATATNATIAIAGGSFEGGASTVTLSLGKALTLMNKNNGRRYQLRLLSIS